MKMYVLVFLGLLAISGCGFEPLYVQRDTASSWYFGGQTDTSISAEMAQIKVEPIADRFGQQVRNSLLDLLTPKGAPQDPKYRLKAKLIRKSVTQQAMRRDITATSERVEYVMGYELWQGNNVVLKSTSEAYVSYDIMANPYSTTMAQKKTESDAAKIIANDMALRIGAYFHKLLNKGAANSDI